VKATVKVHKGPKKVKKAPPKPKPKPNFENAAHHIIVQATKKVWADHDFSTKPGGEYQKDLKNKHWHCRHCHTKCKTSHCHKWCHDTFCQPGYDGGVALPAYSVGQISTPMSNVKMTHGLKQSIIEANKHLAEADKGKKIRVLRQATRAMDNYDEQRKLDMDHFIRQIHREDDLNRAAYGTKEKKKERHMVNDVMEQQHVEATKKLAKSAAKAAKKEVAKNAAVKKGIKAEEKVAKAMEGNSWMNSINKMASRKVDQSDIYGDKVKTTPKIVSKTKVAEKMAQMDVKVADMKAEANKGMKKQHL